MDGKKFDCEKSWSKKRAAKRDAANMACYWMVFGRIMDMAPLLPFQDTPRQCVFRSRQGSKGKKNKIRPVQPSSLATEVPYVRLGRLFRLGVKLIRDLLVFRWPRSD